MTNTQGFSLLFAGLILIFLFHLSCNRMGDDYKSKDKIIKAQQDSINAKNKIIDSVLTASMAKDILLQTQDSFLQHHDTKYFKDRDSLISASGNDLKAFIRMHIQ